MAQLRNARVQKVYTSCGLRPTTKNRSAHLWTLTKIWRLQSLRLRMPWLEASTSFQYSQLYKGSVVSRLTSTISQSISIYHAAHGRVLPGLISRSSPNASVSVRRVVGSQPPLFGPYLESSIPWILQLNENYQTGSCSRVNWAKYSRNSAYLVKILIETVPMKAIHIYICTYIYNQVPSTTQRAHMVKQLHSSLRDSIGRRQSSHLKSSSCRCQSRKHLWSGTVNEMHKSYTITAQVWSCLLPLQCLSQIPQFHCFRLCSIHAVSM